MRSAASQAFTGLVGLTEPVVQAKPRRCSGLHVSANGLAFNPNTNFPAAYDNDLFVAEFGNFFGNTPVGTQDRPRAVRRRRFGHQRSRTS